MPKEINIAVFPDYGDVFDDGNEKEELSFFLKDIPTHNLVSSMSFISACLDTGIDNFETQNFILKELITPLTRKEQLEISNKINSFTGENVKIIFHQFACLLISQTSILNFKSGEEKVLSRDNARNILKAFVWCNSKYSKVMSDLIPSLTTKIDREKIFGMFIVMDIAQSGYFNKRKDILEQSFKLKLFDEFLRKDEEVGKYYIDFLKSKNVSNLLEIIKITWNIFFKIVFPREIFKPEKVKSGIHVDNSDENAQKYFESISIFENEIDDYKKEFKIEDLDFKLIREKPLYKFEKNIFKVLNSNFFVDKLFYSLLFDYYNFISKSGYNGSFADFKSYYSEIFVEKYLLQKILEVVFGRTKAQVKQPGDILKKLDKYNKDYSDYYLRIGKKIVLFECKDTIMRADVKYSYSYEKVISDINKKFIDGVGVDQILKVISSISNNEIPFDKIKDDELESLSIFSVIVYTDLSYNARGLNYVVNTFFRNKINNQKLLFKVNPIVMIHIDTLIDYQDIFRDKVNFINTLEIYNKYILKNEKKSMDTTYREANCLIDYDAYLKKYIHHDRGFSHNNINVYKDLYKQLYSSEIQNEI